MWLPNGARLRSKLEHLLYKAHRVRGYEPVRGPEILKAEMWKISGHYANYKENMYFTTIDYQGLFNTDYDLAIGLLTHRLSIQFLNIIKYHHIHLIALPQSL
jgi:prolyl-tRNA synthetase